MARVAYSASKKQFLYDWDTNQFMDLMCEGAALNHIGGSLSEKRSWESNAAKIRSLLSLSDLPDDVEIAFEYKCPLSGRIDCDLKHVKEELADVLVYCRNMLDCLDLDEDEIVMSKMSRNEVKYPIEKARGSSVKYDQL